MPKCLLKCFVPSSNYDLNNKSAHSLVSRAKASILKYWEEEHRYLKYENSVLRVRVIFQMYKKDIEQIIKHNTNIPS